MNTTRNSRIDDAIAEFLQAAEAGTLLNCDEWLARHPDLKARLEEFLKDQSDFRSVAASIN